MNNWVQILVSDPDRTNALAAVANVVLASSALIIAVASIILSFMALKHQKKHNKLSVRPIPFISLADYVDCLRAKITNNGSGPPIIKSVTVSNASENKADLISWMPPLSPRIFWSKFSSELSNRSVPAGEEIVLLELCGDSSDADFREFREKCRKVLKDLTVTVEFTDIYGGIFSTCVRKLDWFGRK